MHCIQQHNEDRIQDEVKRESRRKKKIRSKFLPYKIPIDRFTSIIDVVKIDWDYSAGDGKAASPLKPSITMNCEQNGAHSYNSNASQSAIQPASQHNDGNINEKRANRSHRNHHIENGRRIAFTDKSK